MTVSGELAEELGEARIRHTVAASINPTSIQLHRSLREGTRHGGNITFRSVLIRSNQFKSTLRRRGASALLESLYRRLAMPHWIWVVEVIHSEDGSEGHAAAEIVIDAGKRSRDLRFLTLRIPGEMWSWLPEADEAAIRPLLPEGAIESVRGYVTRRLTRTAGP